MAKKKSKTRKALDLALPIYQVKITLQHIKPPIWRRVQTNDCSLDELHDIIQVCMGWEDEHMYAFVIDDEEFGNPKQAARPNTILAMFDSARLWRKDTLASATIMISETIGGTPSTSRRRCQPKKAFATLDV